MAHEKSYIGIFDDKFGGMTQVGGIIKDAWVFGLIPESETCAGWSYGQLQVLWDQVSARWDAYGHQVGRLPEELRERHGRIHREAFERARQLGWDPGHGDDGE